MQDKLDRLDLTAFASQSLPAKILQLNELFEARLWSEQLAAIWLYLIDKATDDTVRRIMQRELLGLAPWLDQSHGISTRLLGVSEPRAGVLQVTLIISCEKYWSKAEALLREIRVRLAPVFVVIGDPSIHVAQFHGEVLKVPCPDNYESLPHKVIEALIAVRSEFGSVAVLKIDDDTSSVGEGGPRSLEGMEYAGHAIGDPKFDRAWHIGKCESGSVPPYGMRFRGRWASGPTYWLSARAVDALVREFLLYPGLTEGEWFEDKLVGDTLNRLGFVVTNFNVAQSYGLSQDRGDKVAPLFLPSQTGNGPEPESDFSFDVAEKSWPVLDDFFHFYESVLDRAIGLHVPPGFLHISHLANFRAGTRRVAAYESIAPRTTIGFEDGANVMLGPRFGDKVSRRPGEFCPGFILEYFGPSNWLTLEAEFSWEELSQASSFRLAIIGSTSRVLSCRAVLRVYVSEDKWIDTPLTQMQLTPGSLGSTCAGAMRLEKGLESSSPRVLLFFDCNASFSLAVASMLLSFV
jgi:hypothetical protein